MYLYYKYIQATIYLYVYFVRKHDFSCFLFSEKLRIPLSSTSSSSRAPSSISPYMPPQRDLVIFTWSSYLLWCVIFLLYLLVGLPFTTNSCVTFFLTILSSLNLKHVAYEAEYSTIWRIFYWHKSKSSSTIFWLYCI